MTQAIATESDDRCVSLPRLRACAALRLAWSRRATAHAKPFIWHQAVETSLNARFHALFFMALQIQTIHTASR